MAFLLVRVGAKAARRHRQSQRQQQQSQTSYDDPYYANQQSAFIPRGQRESQYQPRGSITPPPYMNEPQTRGYTTSSKMSAAKQEWLVVVRDFPDSLDKRMAVRPTHINNFVAAADRGAYTMGGGLLRAPASETGGELQLNGSVVVAVADTEAEVRKMLAEDVYAVNGVWDVEGAQIIPIKTAVRTPM